MEGSEVEAAEVKWINDYSSSHQILLVGEGDFSFSLALARAFGSAANITATSLDTREELELKYNGAKDNLEKLEALGCKIIHGINAHTMCHDPILSLKRFDRIIFNFPHAGFDVIYCEHDSFTISLHQEVVSGFLRNSREMVKEEGEVHITHKTAYPFSMWEIEALGEEEGLFLAEEDPFDIWMYPSYCNKRGSGLRCDETFPVGLASTFKFKIFTLVEAY